MVLKSDEVYVWLARSNCGSVASTALYLLNFINRTIESSDIQ